MELKLYNELIKREGQLQEDMKNFILNTINANGGRITYTPPFQDEEDDYVSYEDRFPIIKTFMGKHGTHFDVAITDVYTKADSAGHISIYIDGIDVETDKKCIGPSMWSCIIPEDYSDILYFIMAPLKKQFREFAERLALKDLVDKHNKLPHELYNENGNIKSEYSEGNRENIEKYLVQFEDLYIKCSEPECDKHEINSELMEIICELADLALVEQSQKLMDELVEEVDDNSTRFTEEAQDDFNPLYDEVECQIWALMGFEGI